MFSTFRGAALAAAFLAAGCITAPPPPLPSLAEYVTPPDLTSETAATISGSRIDTPNMFIGDVRVFVALIDSMRLPQGDEPQATLHLVTPGTHYVRILMQRKTTLTSQAFYASTEQFVELEAGKVYVARGEFKDREASIWIEEVGNATEQARAATTIRTLRPPVVVPIIIYR